MATGTVKTLRHDVRVVTLPIDRVADSGWLDLGQLRRFVEEAERVGADGSVRIWWSRGPEDEPPRLEARRHVKLPADLGSDDTGAVISA